MIYTAAQNRSNRPQAVIGNPAQDTIDTVIIDPGADMVNQAALQSTISNPGIVGPPSSSKGPAEEALADLTGLQ